MKREWKPGEVGLVPFRDEAAIGLRINDAWVTRWNLTPLDYVDVRPLVVIDPEDREAVERLIQALADAETDKRRDYIEPNSGVMQAALREFADPKPPKPEEPTGLGAVVEAIYDNHFVHVGNGGWQRVEEGDRQGQLCTYAEIAAVRVLSEGVQP